MEKHHFLFNWKWTPVADETGGRARRREPDPLASTQEALGLEEVQVHHSQVLERSNSGRSQIPFRLRVQLKKLVKHRVNPAGASSPGFSFPGSHEYSEPPYLRLLTNRLQKSAANEASRRPWVLLRGGGIWLPLEA